MSCIQFQSQPFQNTAEDLMVSYKSMWNETEEIIALRDSPILYGRNYQNIRYQLQRISQGMQKHAMNLKLLSRKADEIRNLYESAERNAEELLKQREITGSDHDAGSWIQKISGEPVYKSTTILYRIDPLVIAFPRVYRWDMHSQSWNKLIRPYIFHHAEITGLLRYMNHGPVIAPWREWIRFHRPIPEIGLHYHQGYSFPYRRWNPFIRKNYLNHYHDFMM